MADHITDGVPATHSDAQERVTATKIGSIAPAPTPEQASSWEILGDLYLARINILEHLFETDADRQRRRHRNQLLYGTKEG